MTTSSYPYACRTSLRPGTYEEAYSTKYGEPFHVPASGTRYVAIRRGSKYAAFGATACWTLSIHRRSGVRMSKNSPARFTSMRGGASL